MMQVRPGPWDYPAVTKRSAMAPLSLCRGYPEASWTAPASLETSRPARVS
jgi:hypothetical protein